MQCNGNYIKETKKMNACRRTPERNAEKEHACIKKASLVLWLIH